MCGVFGIVAGAGADQPSSGLARALQILARGAQVRGRDSSGLAVREDGAGLFHVFKGNVPIRALLADGRVASRVSDAVESNARGAPLALMGHSRLVTNGTQLRDDNNQPVLRFGLVGVHNGIIVNDEALWGAHPELDRECDLDTEVFLALTRKGMDADADPAAAILYAAGQVEGTVSVALWFEDRPAVALFTNNGSLYALTDGATGFYFASERHPLDQIHQRVHGAAAEFRVEQLRPDTGVVVDLRDMRPHPFGPTRAGGEAPSPPIVEPVPHAFEVRRTSVSGGIDRELVLDVAEIAAAPRAAREEKLLEWNADRIDELRRCRRCILPETFPFIRFDDEGVCNYCLNYQLKNQPKDPEELLTLLRPYRGNGGQPDCIVPYSGGRDSSYALHLVKTRLGLNPIAFTYDWGMVTDLGRRNIARVCGKLGVENIIVAADIHRKRKNIRKNVSAWLERPHLGMIPLFMAGDKYFYYHVDRVKAQTGIDLNLWGVNPMENTDFKVGFLGVPPDPTKKRIYSLSFTRALRLFGGVGSAVLGNPAYLNDSVLDTLGSFFSRSVKRHRDYFHLFDYFRWDEEEIDTLLLDEYDWERAIDTETTWRIGDGTAAFYNYIYYTVAGFSEHDTFRSNQIREGMISREDALERVRRENRPRYPTIRWYTEVIGVDFERAVRVINAIPKLYPE